MEVRIEKNQPLALAAGGSRINRGDGAGGMTKDNHPRELGSIDELLDRGFRRRREASAVDEVQQIGRCLPFRVSQAGKIDAKGWRTMLGDRVGPVHCRIAACGPGQREGVEKENANAVLAG